MKRILALFLSLCILIAVAGCSRLPGKGGTLISGGTPSPSASPEAPDELDFEAVMAAAREAYAPDTVVMTVDDAEITWDLYFYWVFSQISDYYSYFQSLPEWGEAYTDMGTFDEVYRDSIENMAAYFLIPEAKELPLSTDSEKAIQEDWESFASERGGEEAAAEYLAAVFLTKDMFLMLSRANYAYSDYFTATYGEDGAGLDEQEILDFAENEGYIRAEHILFLTLDSEGNPLSDEEVASTRATAESTLAELQQTPAEDLRTRFEEIMNESSEDTGLPGYPEGYTFLPGTLMEAFEAAAKALEPGEISGIVETDYGLHIILRLPLEADSVSVFDSNNGPGTLRSAAAKSMFNDELTGWVDGAQVVYSDDFRDFTLASLF